MMIVKLTPYFNSRLAWIEQHNMEFEIADVVIDPNTLSRFPRAIKFKHEKDYSWYVLKWGE